MKKIVFVLLLILTLCSCNKTQDLPQEEPTEFKLKMNDDRYIDEVDKRYDSEYPLENYVILKDIHKIYIEMKEDYELKSISLKSIDRSIQDDDGKYFLSEVNFDYTLSKDELSIDVDENYVWNNDKRLRLYFTVEYNGEHDFRISIMEKPNRFRLYFDEYSYISSKDSGYPTHPARYSYHIGFGDYHNLDFLIKDDYEIENISLRSYASNASVTERDDYDTVQFTYNLSNNKLEIKVDENYMLDDRCDLILRIKINKNGEHYFWICLID